MDYVQAIVNIFPHLQENIADAERIVDWAKTNYYDIVYKGDRTIYDEDDIDTPRKQSWILARCIEIVERAGCSSATAYRENGLQINFDNSQISLGLINMLSPVVGVIKR